MMSIVNLITSQPEKDGIPLADCRSQCYDNASVMSGHVSGVQKRILGQNPKALYTNCDNHSLNLCGVHASNVEPELATFFDAVERLWTFFSRSSSRWSILKEALGCLIKQECETRWSARAGAVEVIYKNYSKIVSVLEEMNELAAYVVLSAITSYNFPLLHPFWHRIFQHIDRVQIRLQDPTINFREAACDTNFFFFFFFFMHFLSQVRNIPERIILISTTGLR